MRRIGGGQMGLRIKLTGGDGGLGGGVMRELIFGIKDGRVDSIKDRELSGIRDGEEEWNQGRGGRMMSGLIWKVEWDQEQGGLLGSRTGRMSRTRRKCWSLTEFL